MAHKATSAAPLTVAPGPFIRIIYGQKKELYVNLNCSVLSFMRYVHKETGIPEREFDLCTDKGLIIDLQSIYSSEEGALSRQALEEAAEEPIETHLKARTSYLLLKIVDQTPEERPHSSLAKRTPAAANDDWVRMRYHVMCDGYLELFPSLELTAPARTLNTSVKKKSFVRR
eukprot:m.5851 g.5851  ORF g.5851 m.5851 type:complete len:172 (-) comp4640_c0_seq1:121-636(-)